MAGVEEGGGVGVHESLFQDEEPLDRVVPVVPGKACRGTGARGAGRRTPATGGPDSAPHPSAPRPGRGLTLVAQLEVEQGVDAAHGLLAGGRPQVRTPWGEEADEEAQVVEGHQGLRGRGGAVGCRGGPCRETHRFPQASSKQPETQPRGRHADSGGTPYGGS